MASIMYTLFHYMQMFSFLLCAKPQIQKFYFIFIHSFSKLYIIELFVFEDLYI